MTLKKLRIGLVCPYGWDTPGGVQSHVRDLAEYLISKGHYVSVLAPVINEENVPEYVTSAGKPIAIPYNGAVARVLFGPIAFARVRQWISNGNFDLLHLHEPAIPSISLLACWAAEGPMVGTFHAAAKRQKAIFAIGPILEPVIEKLTARIAVSEEPRKGLSVLLDALPIIARFAPDVRVLVAGPGDEKEVSDNIDPQLRHRFEFLGRISEKEKADFLSSVAIYVAPNTGGESFGIILAEALAGGATVLASDMPAFDSLLCHGQF